MKTVIRDPEIQRRFREFLDLNQTAEDMARQRFRREDPSRSEEEIERMVVDWWRRGATASLPGCRPRHMTFE